MLRFIKRMILSASTETSGYALHVGFTRTDGHSLSWLSSTVLISYKLILLNKSHLFTKCTKKCDLPHDFL